MVRFFFLTCNKQQVWAVLHITNKEKQTKETLQLVNLDFVEQSYMTANGSDCVSPKYTLITRTD